VFCHSFSPQPSAPSGLRAAWAAENVQATKMTISNVVFAIAIPVDGDEPARRLWDEPVVGEQGEGGDGYAQLEGLPVPYKVRHCIQAKHHLSMLLYK
jgi:hypothetical protein